MGLWQTRRGICEPCQASFTVEIFTVTLSLSLFTNSCVHVGAHSRTTVAERLGFRGR